MKGRWHHEVEKVLGIDLVTASLRNICLIRLTSPLSEWTEDLQANGGADVYSRFSEAKNRTTNGPSIHTVDAVLWNGPDRCF